MKKANESMVKQIIASLLTNLSADKLDHEMAQWAIMHPKELVYSVVQLINNRCCLQAARVFKTRWTIKVGTHPTIESLVDSVNASGSRIRGNAHSLLHSMILAIEETEVELVGVCGIDLGFPANYEATLPEIIARGRMFNLLPCTDEDAFQLRRQYKEQPEDEHLMMALESSMDSSLSPHLTIVKDHSGKLLHINSVRSDFTFEAEHVVWVFRRGPSPR